MCRATISRKEGRVSLENCIVVGEHVFYQLTKVTAKRLPAKSNLVAIINCDPHDEYLHRKQDAGFDPSKMLGGNCYEVMIGGAKPNPEVLRWFQETSVVRDSHIFSFLFWYSILCARFSKSDYIFYFHNFGLNNFNWKILVN